MRVDVDAAAAELWKLARSGDHAPLRWASTLTLDDALAVQLTNLGRKEEAGERLAGWKVGLTSPRARKMLGADERPFGHLLEAATLTGTATTPATVTAADMTEPHIEPELCFFFARPVDDASQLTDAVGSVHAGFELNENRPGTVREDFPLAVADNLSHWGIVMGDGASPVGLDLNGVAVELRCDDEVRYQGISSEVLDDHWASLARLVEVLGSHSRRIEAGHRVITGAFCRLPIAAGQTWRASYAGIGSVVTHVA